MFMAGCKTTETKTASQTPAPQVAAQPVPPQPAATQPATGQPATAQPVAVQPAVTQPAAQPVAQPALQTTTGTVTTSEAPVEKAQNDSDVLVEVNGAKLTRGQANIQVEKFMAAKKGQIPPALMDVARKQIIESAIDQFVGRTLLEQEIKKQNIQVTKEDETAMYKELSLSLPNGTTIDDMIKRNPDKADQIREQIANLIKADKMLGDKLKVTDKEISDFMDQNKEKLAIPENVHARHILIAVEKTDDEKTKAEKKKKAEDIRDQLVKGADFAELAKKYSDCPSKENGGDLGVFPKEGTGAPVPAFANAAFSQELKAIGPVVESEFGYHVIQVLDHNKATVLTREQVAFQIKQDKRDKAVMEMLEQLKSKASIKYLEPRPANEDLEGMPAMPGNGK